MTTLQPIIAQLPAKEFNYVTFTLPLTSEGTSISPLHDASHPLCLGRREGKGGSEEGKEGVRRERERVRREREEKEGEKRKRGRRERGGEGSEEGDGSGYKTGRYASQDSIISHTLNISHDTTYSSYTYTCIYRLQNIISI